MFALARDSYPDTRVAKYSGLRQRRCRLLSGRHTDTKCCCVVHVTDWGRPPIYPVTFMTPMSTVHLTTATVCCRCISKNVRSRFCIRWTQTRLYRPCWVINGRSTSLTFWLSWNNSQLSLYGGLWCLQVRRVRRPTHRHSTGTGQRLRYVCLPKQVQCRVTTAPGQW